MATLRGVGRRVAEVGPFISAAPVHVKMSLRKTAIQSVVKASKGKSESVHGT